MKNKVFSWLIPLVLLLLLIPFIIPSSMSYAGAEELPVFEKEELANPHPAPLSFSEKAPYAPHADGWLPEQGGYVDGTISVRIETRKVYDTLVFFTSIQIADPSQLRTASYKPYPRKDEIRANKIAERERAVMAINGDWFVGNGGFGIVYRNGEMLRAVARFSSFDALIVDTDGNLHPIPQPTAQDFAPWEGRILHSFCFGPALVIDGEKVTLEGGNQGRGLMKKTQRQAICQLGPLHYLTITSQGPEQKGSAGLTIEELAQLCFDCGAVQAYNLDGGSSTNLVLNNEKINHKTPRPITDIIYFVTAEPDPGEA